MSVIMPWLVSSIILLLLFGVLLLIGIVRKRVNLVIAAVASFVLFMIAGGITAYKMIKVTVTAAEGLATGKTGEEIYEDLLGAKPGQCVIVYASSAAIIATSGEPASVCFKTCPEEMRHVLSLATYEVAKRPTSEVAMEAEKCCDNYFSYARFGDTLSEYIRAEEHGRTCTIWLSMDSTHAFSVAK